MDAIQELIISHKWDLKCWDDRYKRGIWAIIVPHHNYGHTAREIMDGGDIESMTLGDYFFEEGSWLPVANGNDLTTVLEQLEGKVNPLIYNSIWRQRVDEAFLQIIDENDGSYGLQNAIDRKERRLLKPKELE